MMYWYETCTGGIFSTEYELTHEEMYCDKCGDGSTYIGIFDTEEEAIEALNGDIYE